MLVSHGADGAVENVVEGSSVVFGDFIAGFLGHFGALDDGVRDAAILGPYLRARDEEDLLEMTDIESNIVIMRVSLRQCLTSDAFDLTPSASTSAANAVATLHVLLANSAVSAARRCCVANCFCLNAQRRSKSTATRGASSVARLDSGSTRGEPSGET